MRAGPVVVSFVGPSGVGKTTLVERVVPLLRGAGLTVATVKHASHGFEADREGSDSWRHRAAGADAVLLVGPTGVALFVAPTEVTGFEHLSELIDRHLHGYDIVLTEGFAPVRDVLVLLRRKDVAPKPIPLDPPPWLTVTDDPHGDGELGFDQLDVLAARIVALVTHDHH